MTARSVEINSRRPVSGRSEEPGVVTLVGVAAVAFSLLYLLSDVIELIQGGFSTPQLALTYASEAAIPLFVLGLAWAQGPWIGLFGLLTALAYAYTFVFFTDTVVYAIVNHTGDWNALQKQFGAWITVHSVLMVVAGVLSGLAVIRARVLPRWTGAALIAGMVLMAATVALPVVQRPDVGWKGVMLDEDTNSQG
jgi:hypothetical protein